ncbi:low affinity sulfate transporter 3 [Ricinus communis]|uniref:Sulfate transporter, putative n=1 Tax=Ricinus communis TaxID=3988 RepID=B9RJF7_RICCO|nr:low affinity sulfate transporter 3 [Ricinus communis]EEF48459.1 sulfate transporter, putative [Ricinus communis]|eukprot:XP_002513876.1 low affinity sulfate transporter 3 [Ricinus communis]
MGSQAADQTLRWEELQQLDIDDAKTSQLERANWVMNSPDPPGLLSELVASVKAIVFPHGKKTPKQAGATKPAISFLQSLFPILSWGRGYRVSKFKSDLMAGLTLASLSIPQSIGYANLAKLDPQYGLYTSVVPPLIYSVMGSSREIAIGPVAVVSMLLSSMIQDIQDPVADPAAYRKLVFTVTFFAGTFQAIFGLFRLGFLVDFLSHAAIVGFMAGAAIVIGLQQLKGLLGISHFTTKTDVVSVLHSVFTSIDHPWSPLNFVLGCSFLIFLLFARFIGRRNKKFFWLPAIAPLISVILSTLIVFLAKADKHGVNIVKHIKEGLNPSSVHDLQFNGPHVGQTAKIGLISAIIALTEAIAVGRSFASIKGYHLDGNKEMVAMGFMNIAGSLTSCYVATGSFSRTAVNFSAGCETVVSNIVMAITVLLSLELFTRLLYYTPIAILASIILSALPGLINIHEICHIWKVDKLDFIACIGAFFGVLFASVEIGLLVAVTISFLKILLNSIRPGIEELGRIPRTDTYSDINQYPMAIKTSGILTVRINSALLCFANANFIRERIMSWVTEKDDKTEDNTNGRIQAVILDLSTVTNIDTAGIIALEELHKKLLTHETELVLANPRWQVMHKLRVAKFLDRIGREKIFLTVGEAVDATVTTKLNSC